KSLIWIMMVGSIVGTVIITLIHSKELKYIFSFVVFIAAIFMLRFKYGKSKTIKLPKFLFKLLASFVGGLSSLVGVAIFTVPFFVLSGVEIKKAIGTSTLIVLTFASISAVWLTISGIPLMGIGWNHIGYANLPILLSSLIPSIIGGLVGAKLVHILPSHVLKRVFVGMMFVASGVMFF
ncbi:MAG: putative membrane protein YfcA, partial [Francisellaceae bacterium]